MPLINVRLIENAFAPEQKQQITRDLTEAVAIAGERMRGVTWCVIEEVKAATGPSAASQLPPEPAAPSPAATCRCPSDQSAHVAKAWRDTLCARRIPT